MRCLISISGGGSFAQYARDCGRLRRSKLEIVSDRRNNRIGDDQVEHFIVRKGNPRYWDEFSALACGYDLVFLNSNWILPATVLRALEGRFILNQHPSLLPSFKGLHVWEDILASGVRVSGATYHLVAEEVDAGPIIAQVAYGVPAGLDVEGLQRLHFEQCKDAYVEVLQWFEEGRVTLAGEGQVFVVGGIAGGRILSPSIG